MNITALKHVRQLWNTPYAPPGVNRANQLKWVRAVRRLGDKWLIAKPLEIKNER